MILWVWASLVAQMVKKLPAMRKTQVWSLGQEEMELGFKKINWGQKYN